MAGIHEPVQHSQEFLHVVEVKTRGRLIHDIEEAVMCLAARRKFHQFTGDLQPLGLTP